MILWYVKTQFPSVQILSKDPRNSYWKPASSIQLWRNSLYYWKNNETELKVQLHRTKGTLVIWHYTREGIGNEWIINYCWNKACFLRFQYYKAHLKNNKCFRVWPLQVQTCNPDRSFVLTILQLQISVYGVKHEAIPITCVPPVGECPTRITLSDRLSVSLI